MALTIPLPDLSATEAIAQWLAPLLRVQDVIALTGPLGAGKTTFARSLLHTLGVADDVPSPTFTMVQFYETSQFSIYHFDLYRLEAETDLTELGWDEATADGLTIVEWPERAPSNMPDDRLVLHFILDDKEQRSLIFEPLGGWADRLVALP